MQNLKTLITSKLERLFGAPAAQRIYEVSLIVGLASLYYVMAIWGLKLSFQETNSSPIWPPSGIAFAALLILGYRMWPAVWIGAFVANIAVFSANHFADFPTIFLVSFFIAIGNTLEALLGVFLMNCFVGSRNPLFKTRDIFQFVLVAFVATLAAATVGTTAVSFAKHFTWPIFKVVWYTWWLGDTLSILILTSFLLILYKSYFKIWSLRRTLEGIALLSFLVGINAIIFGTKSFLNEHYFPAIYLILPLMVWFTYRFSHWGTTLVSMVTLLFGIYGTSNGWGPFFNSDLNFSLLLLQVFIGILTITGLVLAAALHERYKAEEELRYTSQRFKALVENSRDMVALMDSNAIIFYASPSITKVLGYPTEDYVGHHLLELIHPDDHANITKLLKEAFVKPGAMVEGQCRCFHKDGVWRWVEGTAHNLLNEPGIHGVVLNYRDITARKESEEARINLAAIVENSDEAIIGKSLEGVITSWNKGARRLYGYIEQEIVGKSIDVLFPQEKKEELAHILRELKQGHKIEQLETLRLHKNGRLIDVLVTISPIKDGVGNLIGASTITHDITERKLAEKVLKRDKEDLEILVDERSKELLSTQKELKQATRLADIGTLAATVAHELRNPLGVIQMAAYNLKRKSKNPVEDKHLVNIEKKVWEGNRIIDNLLSYSRIKIPSYEKVSLLTVLDECISSTQSRFQDYQVTVVKRYESEHMDIEVDPHQIKEIFVNILNNAYQAFPYKIGKIEVIVTHNQDNYASIIFKDNGSGIEEEDLDKIFVPFFTRKSKGTGLGMTICNELINLHQGKLIVTSRKNEGTSVNVILPMVRTHNE